MRRLILMLSVLALVACSVAAPSALAYTKAQAEGRSLEDAQNKWGGTATLKGCSASGKNEKGVAQYYCNGNLNFGAEEWKINLDPYGTITYEHR